MANAEIELPLLAARLKAAGMVGVRREMVAGLRRAAKPLIPDMRESARQSLPRAGGLNETVAQQPIRTSVRTGARTAGVSIRAQWTRTDRGSWRHPVFGNRDAWVTQTYRPADQWYEHGAEKGTPEAQREMQAILATVAAQVQGFGV